MRVGLASSDASLTYKLRFALRADPIRRQGLGDAVLIQSLGLQELVDVTGHIYLGLVLTGLNCSCYRGAEGPTTKPRMFPSASCVAMIFIGSFPYRDA